MNKNIEASLSKDSVFIVGYVSGVDGRKVIIKVNKNKNASHLLYAGEVLKNVSVGGFIKITKGFIQIIGKIEGEYIRPEKSYNQDYSNEVIKISRYLEVSLFGNFENGKFSQGIKEMPLIDNECYLLDKTEFLNLHKFYKEGEPTINIGSLSDEPSQNVQVSINKWVSPS